MKNGIIIILMLLPLVAFAHQPQIVNTETVIINNPEISKAYYDELKGTPRIYRLKSDIPFQLSLSVLVPKSSNPDGRYSLAVYHVNKMRKKVGSVDAAKVEWTTFHEPFANEYYLQAPAIEKQLGAGTYEIWVLDDHDTGKYVLAIGDKDEFSFTDLFKTIPLLLQLKKDFFNESPATFALSIIGAFYFITFLLLGAVIAFLWHLVHRLMMKLKFIKYQNITNLNLNDRLLRLIIGVAFLLMGFEVWYAALFIIAGFMFYESIVGWCLLYTFIRK